MKAPPACTFADARRSGRRACAGRLAARARREAACLLWLAAAAPALAQFKWVESDGRVTYGDRPPKDARDLQRVEGFAPAPKGPLDGMPYDLKRVAENFPVVLYTIEACSVCEEARALLRQRGIPYAERQIVGEADRLAYERLQFGARVPGLQVGNQRQSGFETSMWNDLLDAAGYPRDSRLPRTWPAPVARPLVEAAPPSAVPPAEAGDAAPKDAAADAPAAPLPPVVPASGGFRF